jgi:hypothetical protein
MSQLEQDSLMDCLFSEADMKLKNIKFFRGGRDLLSSHALSSEAHSATLQKRLRSAVASTSAPRSGQPKVNVRVLVADL